MVGRAARIRESSVTLPSARGTLKSTRTKTRFPATSASRIVSLSIVVLSLAWGRAPARPGVEDRPGGSGSDGRREPGRDHRDEVGAAAAVAPLVVVPGDDLHHRAAEDHGARAVDDRGAGIAAEVGRDEGGGGGGGGAGGGKGEETRGSSETPRMPSIGPAAAARNAALSSSALVSRP